MDTERNLLFGVVALQSGAVDADGLSETCAAWAAEPTLPLADVMVGRGLMTDEQRSQIEETVARELASHGDDPHATLEATLDGRSLEALGGAVAAGGRSSSAPSSGSLSALAVASFPPEPGAGGQGGHVVLGRLSPGEADARERYTLTHLHAKGGMGRVWLARDGALGRQIALKELRPDQTDNAIVCSRFLYEAKVTAQLEHPGIVPVYELGEGDAPYYTMRFVRGKTLSEAIRAYHKKRAAGEADTVGMHELLTQFVSVCHAVAYAHSRGIIHRDLKGQNIVLGDFGEVIVLDWGLAKRVGPDPALAPAQAQGPQPSAPPADGPVHRMDPEAATAATCAAAPSDDGLTTSEDSDDDATSAGSILDAVAGSDSGYRPGSNGSHGSNGSADPAGSSSGRPVPESGAGPEGTMAGQLLGTPAYMAPEQAQARHDLVDQRTDIYGLGAILYEVLTGRPPFVAPKTSEVIKKVINESPTPPRQIVPEIAPGLEAVCLKALRKAKPDRYQTASELAQEVRHYLADEPVKAFAEPWTLRAQRWMRRNRTKVAAAAALLVTATLALAVSTFLVTRERNEAEAQGEQARHAVHLLARGADIAFDDQLDPVQKEILQDALNYYEKFTGRASNNPSVRLEHGRAFQQMGDIDRKLGNLGGSEKAYLRAIEKLEPLTGVGGDVGRTAKRLLARTCTLLGDVLVRSGGAKDKAGPLYGRALEAQRVLADAQQDPAATPEDIVFLGRTYKSRGDLLRLEGKFAEAGTAYDRAIAELRRAPQGDPKLAEARADLALAIDARGWIHRERGELAEAEADYRRAVDLLETLVADFPTVPRHREALARALNSLALIEESTDRLADAETHLNAELPLVERLSQDFRDRPEYRRILVRTLSNLGGVLRARNRVAEAEPILERAVKINDANAAASPDDVQIRFDLSKDLHNLGVVLRDRGQFGPAQDALQKARSINEKLVKAFPDQPRYRNALADNLVNLGLVLSLVDPPRAEEVYRSATSLYDELIKAHPEILEYRIGQARCLSNQGLALTAANQLRQAEAAHRRALALLDAKEVGADLQGMRTRAEVLTNLGEVLRIAGRPEAEAIFLEAQRAFTELASRPAATPKDRHNLAIVANNLGDTMYRLLRRLPEAEAMLARSEADFEKLIVEAPKSADFHSQLAQVQGLKGTVLAELGRLSEAAAVMAKAVGHQEYAAILSRGRRDIRDLHGTQLLELAEVDLKQGAYPDAADLAFRAPRVVADADRGATSFKAARILARLAGLVGGDAKLVPVDREKRIRPYLSRSIMLLREAFDSNPKLAERIKDAPEFQAIASSPEFQTMMDSLVGIAR